MKTNEQANRVAEAVTETMNSGQIAELIEKLVKLYDNTFRDELTKMAVAYGEQSTNEAIRLMNHHDYIRSLMQLISSNQGRWSGGHSASNMFEQIKREAAQEFLSDVLRDDAAAARLEAAERLSN